MSFLRWRNPLYKKPHCLRAGVGVGVSTGVGVGVGVGLGVSVGACVSECVIACVRDCFEKAWAMPKFGYQTWLKRRFGKAWAAADIDADTCLHTPNLIDDCVEKAWAKPEFGVQTLLWEGLGHARYN